MPMSHVIVLIPIRIIVFRVGTVLAIAVEKKCLEG